MIAHPTPHAFYPGLLWIMASPAFVTTVFQSVLRTPRQCTRQRFICSTRYGGSHDLHGQSDLTYESDYTPPCNGVHWGMVVDITQPKSTAKRPEDFVRLEYWKWRLQTTPARDHTPDKTLKTASNFSITPALPCISCKPPYVPSTRGLLDQPDQSQKPRKKVASVSS